MDCWSKHVLVMCICLIVLLIGRLWLPIFAFHPWIILLLPMLASSEALIKPTELETMLFTCIQKLNLKHQLRHEEENVVDLHLEKCPIAHSPNPCQYLHDVLSNFSPLQQKNSLFFCGFRWKHTMVAKKCNHKCCFSKLYNFQLPPSQY